MFCFQYLRSKYFCFSLILTNTPEILSKTNILKQTFCSNIARLDNAAFSQKLQMESIWKTKLMTGSYLLPVASFYDR